MLGNRVRLFPATRYLCGVDHRQPSQALAEERYRRLVEHSPDGICVHRDGRILYVNEAGARLMRADSSDHRPPVTDFMSPESIPPMRQALLRCETSATAPRTIRRR